MAPPAEAVAGRGRRRRPLEWVSNSDPSSAQEGALAGFDAILSIFSFEASLCGSVGNAVADTDKRELGMAAAGVHDCRSADERRPVRLPRPRTPGASLVPNGRTADDCAAIVLPSTNGVLDDAFAKSSTSSSAWTALREVQREGDERRAAA